MTNYQGYLAAVERLNRVASGEDPKEVYRLGPSMAMYAIGHDKATVYDFEHDPAPLTVALIEAELGKADKFGQWKVSDQYIGWNTPFRCANVYGFTFTTLGHLRQIVAMLRGGAA